MDCSVNQEKCNNLQPLSELIANNEDWLMYRILEYAKQRGYTQYTSTLAEAWRVSICGLSDPMLEAIANHAGIPELDPNADYTNDPITSFGIIEAQRHRTRGVTLSLFLGLMKYYRQAYLDLLELGNFTQKQTKLFELFINRFYDRIELGFCVEWISLTESDKLEELQEKNRVLTNEKNKYLTIFESINECIFLFDNNHNLINLNEEAAKTFSNLQISGSLYYGINTEKIELPWLNQRIIQLNQENKIEDYFTINVNSNYGEIWVNVKLQKMLDVSEKFTGTVVICSNITELITSKEQLIEAQHIGHFGNWSWNLQTGELNWSKEVYAIFGEDIETFKPDYNNFLAKIYSEDLELFKQLEKEALATGNNYKIDYRIFAKNGLKWINHQAFITCKVDNKSTQIIGIIQDITERKEIEIALQESEAKLKTIININVNALMVINQEGRVLFVNPAAEKIFDKKAELLLGNIIGLPLVTGESTEVAIPQKNGQLIIADMRITPIYWEKENAYLAVLVDLTKRKEAEAKLTIFYKACEQSPASIVITNYQGNIEYVNPKFEIITGYSKDEVLGKNPRVLKSGYTSNDEYVGLWKTLSSGQEWYGEFHNRKKNGEFFWEYASISPIKDENNHITHYVAVKEDITKKKKDQELLSHQANYDSLTDLPNRLLGIDRLKQEMAKADRNRKYIGVIFLDLDHFKNVNDTLGHKYGDELLILSSQRLTHCLRKTDTVARLGGDEFLIIISALDSPYECKAIACKLVTTMQQSFLLAGEEIFISASIGITIYPDDANNIEILMQNADMAMYEAKKKGRNNFQFFTSILNEAAQKRMLQETHLRHALNRQELYLVYQPIINLKTKKVVGAETLMRWHNPQLGQVSPLDFIAVAEETGLIIDLGKWLLETVCQQLSTWHKNGFLINIAVNLSPRQFRCLDLPETIAEIVGSHGIKPEYIKLEITEQLLLEDVPSAKESLFRLQEMNFSLSMDDFGTGYSSLSYLKKYPFSVLKIDKSFITDIPNNEDAQALVKTIIAMANGLKLQVVAEGIETKEQLIFLEKESCHYGQGYLFSPPLNSDLFTDYLQKKYQI